MKTVIFVPSICKGDDAKWEGEVVLRLPTFDEKFDYIDQMNVEFTDDGSVEISKSTERMRQVRKMVSLSEKHYVSVKLKAKDGSSEANSFEEMQYEQDLHEVLIEIGSKILHGFKAGNG